MDAGQFARSCGECERLRRRVRALETQVEELTRALEAAQRAGKRQAAPFSKGKPKSQPKKPGRKAGRKYGKKARLEPPPQERIDEVHRALLPERCAHCGGSDLERRRETAVQYQIEIPRRPIWRRFDIELGTCRTCGKSVPGRHALQTSQAVGAAGVMLGGDAQAAVGFLNKKCGLSHGKVAWVFRDLFGIGLSRGGSAQVVLRLAKKSEATYEQIRTSLRNSTRVRADETGWRIGGRLGWLHALVGEQATCYLIRRSRGAEVPAEVLTFDYAGTLLHDGWAPYQHFTQATHAQCVQHALTRAGRLRDTATRGAVRFPRQVIAVLRDALRCRRRLARRGVPANSPSRLHWYYDFTDRLAGLVLNKHKTHAANARFARHLARHITEWFRSLLDPGLEAANWRGEQAVRQAVVNRKVWGGSRSHAGAHAQEVLMSIHETCRQQQRNPITFFANLLRTRDPTLLPHTT